MSPTATFRCEPGTGFASTPSTKPSFSAYWERNDGSIADWPGLAPLIAAAGADPQAVQALADSDEIQAELAAETDAALARGVFGAPTMFVGDEMFWGKDRMDFLEAELAAASEAAR